MKKQIIILTVLAIMLLLVACDQKPEAGLNLPEDIDVSTEKNEIADDTVQEASKQTNSVKETKADTKSSETDSFS